LWLTLFQTQPRGFGKRKYWPISPAPILSEALLYYEESMKPGEIKNQFLGFLDSWFPHFLFLGVACGLFHRGLKRY
jgi:hypothetical protein